jgi:hypothetical protein
LCNIGPGAVDKKIQEQLERVFALRLWHPHRNKALVTSRRWCPPTQTRWHRRSAIRFHQEGTTFNPSQLATYRDPLSAFKRSRGRSLFRFGSLWLTGETRMLSHLATASSMALFTKIIDVTDAELRSTAPRGPV